MKRPFNLVLTFSTTSLLAIVALMVSLSWLLGREVEMRLMAQDQLLVTATVQAEAIENLIGDAPFETLHQNQEILQGIFKELLSIPGTKEFEILDTSGQVLWSTDGDVGEKEVDPDIFSKVLSGKSVLEYYGDTEDFDYEEESDSDEQEYYSELFVPVLRGQEVIGVFELHRDNEALFEQVEDLQEKVQRFTAVFGLGLYVLLMGIIIPASRILKKQHRQLSETANSLKAVNETLKQTQNQLLQKERLSAIGEVCGAVAHGLKNPVASVRSAVQLLGTVSVSSDERQEITQDILHEVDRLTKRLNDLLNFIRPFDMNLQYTQLQELLKHAIQALKWKAKEDDIDIQLESNEGYESLSVDASLIEEAILIVLSNAMDASFPGKTIVCRILSKEDSQIIEIRDEGKGMNPQIRSQIFECFFTTRSQGVGLGLALCKKIIDLHQGKITVESEEGQGSTFYLELPINREKGNDAII